MPDSSADRDPLERLAEEFVARFRAGEHPSLTEYANRLPELSDEVRDLFPALIEMEQLKPVSGDLTSDYTNSPEPTSPSRVGEFRLLRKIGHGGMGVVYEAVQESLGRHVALKILPSEAVADPKRLERFRREAKSAAKLHHTNIVPVFGVGEADGRHYYAMQFIGGHPLDAVIDEVRRLRTKSTETKVTVRAISEVAQAMVTGTFNHQQNSSSSDAVATVTDGAGSSCSQVSSRPGSHSAFSNSLSDDGRHYANTVARIGAQVADGLAYAHGQGILHRDIKPANLLLDLRGTVWVTDFGLAKSADADDLTQIGDVVGTLRYMAPERFEGTGDHRADIYALGLTLYELLTLKPAFTAESRAKLVEQVIAANPPKPRSLNPAIPKDLETVVLKAIARDPAMRYQNASDLADDLHRHLEDRPIRAIRATARERAWRWCRRNPALASAMTAVLLVFAIGTAVSSYFAIEAGRKEKDAIQQAQRADAKSKELVAEQARLQTEQNVTRRLLYDSQINRAGSALKEDRVALVQQLLSETTPQPGEQDLRGWEWHYMNRLANPKPVSEFSLEDKGELIELSPDHRLIVTSRRSGDGRVFEVWDNESGRRIVQIPKQGVFPKLPGSANSWDNSFGFHKTMTFTGDGKCLAISDRVLNGNLATDRIRFRIWNLETGDEQPGPPEEMVRNSVRSYAVGPDGAWVSWAEWPLPASFGSRFAEPVTISVARWERETGKTERKPITVDPGLFDLSPDGDAAISYPSILELQTGQVKSDLPFQGWDLKPGIPQPDWKVSITWASRSANSPGNSYGPSRRPVISDAWRVAAFWIGREIQVYRLKDGKLIWKFLTSDGPLGMGDQLSHISDDGTIVMIERPNRIDVLARTQPPQEPLSGEGELTAVRTSTLRIGQNPFSMRTLSPDGQSVLAFQPNTRKLSTFALPQGLDYSEYWRQAAIPARIEYPFNKPGEKVYSSVIRNETGEEIYRWSPGNRPALGAGPRLVIPFVCLGGRRLVVCDSTKTTGFGGETWKLFSTDDKKELKLLAEGEGVPEVDQRTGVLSARKTVEGGQTTFWSLQTGENLGAEARSISSLFAHQYRPAPVGREYAILTSEPSTDGTEPKEATTPGQPNPAILRPITIRQFEKGTGRELWSRELGIAFVSRNGHCQLQLDYSPDGRLIVVVYRPETSGPTKFWIGRASDGNELKRFEILADHEEPEIVARLECFTPNGKMIITALEEIQIWDPETGQKIVSLRGHDQLEDLTVSADSSRLFVKDLGASMKSRLQVWDLVSGRDLLTLEVPRESINQRGTFVLSDGKFFIVNSNGVQVLDGSPVNP